MTKIKKTLGRNWTCYRNYYGMTHILERACSKKLHWNRETIREYTVSHAPEVNYKKAKQHVDNPPQRFCTFGAKLQDMTDRQNTVTPASVLPSGKWIDAASME